MIDIVERETYQTVDGRRCECTRCLSNLIELYIRGVLFVLSSDGPIHLPGVFVVFSHHEVEKHCFLPHRHFLWLIEHAISPGLLQKGAFSHV